MSENKEAIILAGGLGTRLRSAIPDLPKCMAEVAGYPFLYHVINYLRMQGIEKFIFSLGYKHEIIEEYLQLHFPTLQYEIALESTPLGTGGAIRLAMEKVSGENVLVANGDTLFRINVAALTDFHNEHKADCTLALKPMQNFDRYGVVELNDDDSVKNFREKAFFESGNINGGIYLLNKQTFILQEWPGQFSFEKDYLERKSSLLAGMIQDAYFIDIGIPEDLDRAQQELKQPILDLKNINHDWTLFLDRDGVINEDKLGSYIFNADEFVFMEGAPALFKKLNDTFKRIFIVTNQRGVGRGLMSVADLDAIHKKMLEAINNAGGKIDGIYYCDSITNDHPRRKPNPGMALQAKNDFPDVDLSKSIMVGNNTSDMYFGRNAGIHTVFVRTTNKTVTLPHPAIDQAFDTLADFTKAL